MRLTRRVCVAISIGCVAVLTLAQLLLRIHNDELDRELSEGHRNNAEWEFVPMKLAPGQKQEHAKLHVLWKLTRSVRHWARTREEQDSKKTGSGVRTNPKSESGQMTRQGPSTLGRGKSTELLAVFRKWQRKHPENDAMASRQQLNPHGGNGKLFDREKAYFSFMHIPRTAGAAFLTVVRRILNCPTHCSCSAMRICHAECPQLIHQCGHSIELLPNWFVKAHSGHVLLVSLTMIRNPLARLSSVLRIAQRTKLANKNVKSCCGLPSQAMAAMKVNTPLDQFAQVAGVSNAMTRMLAGYEPSDDTVTAGSVMLDMAKRRLASLSFFGLTERFNDSARLLLNTLRNKGIYLPEPDELLRSTLSDHKAANDVGVFPNADKLHHVESYDLELYKFAKELFEKRLCESHISCSEQPTH